MTGEAAPADPPVRAVDAATVSRLTGFLEGITPWSGHVEASRGRNFLGVVFPKDMANQRPARHLNTRLPDLSHGEGYAEWYSTYQAIMRAQGSFTMVSLGAHYGGPLVNAAFMVGAVRPMPVRLVAVEGDPNMCIMMREYARENEIGEDVLTVINAVVSADNRPSLFPVSEVRTGANRALIGAGDIKAVCESVVANDYTQQVLEGLLAQGRSGLYMTIPGTEAQAELQLKSAVTIGDVVSPHDRVDYLEIDIQSAELHALPPFIDLLKRKVGWIHLGTHGNKTHRYLAELFALHGFEAHIDWEPETEYATPDGAFRTQDGVLALSNTAID